jgi:hypothetical protein
MDVSIAGNKIERGIGNTDDQIFGYASISEAKGKVHQSLLFNDSKNFVEYRQHLPKVANICEAGPQAQR